jgi:hypothetical protein
MSTPDTGFGVGLSFKFTTTTDFHTPIRLFCREVGSEAKAMTLQNPDFAKFELQVRIR